MYKGRSLDEHHRSVCHVDSHLNHRGGYQDIHFSVAELAHDPVLFLGGHPAVEQSNIEVGKDLLRQPPVLFRGRSGFDKLRLFHQGADDEGLTPRLYLFAKEAVGRWAALGRQPPGRHLLTALGQFIDGGDVQVAV